MNKKVKAFTLIEVLIVMSIVFVIIGASVASYEQFVRARSIAYLQSLGPYIYNQLLVWYFAGKPINDAAVNQAFGYLNKFITDKNSAFTVTWNVNGISINANTDNFGTVNIFQTASFPQFVSASSLWGSSLGQPEYYEGAPSYWRP
ncbi:MAG: prepilin-type N-terminal cleavage/methylation domain-containing protein [Thermoproteota archaeon]